MKRLVFSKSKREDQFFFAKDECCMVDIFDDKIEVGTVRYLFYSGTFQIMNKFITQLANRRHINITYSKCCILSDSLMGDYGFFSHFRVGLFAF